MNRVKPRTIAYGIRRVRIERGMSQQAVARILECSISHISHIETGKRGIDPAAVSAALGIPVSELLRPCPNCHYDPPHGYRCVLCGMSAALVPQPGAEET